jgi:hypothetical protein
MIRLVFWLTLCLTMVACGPPKKDPVDCAFRGPCTDK